MISVPYDYSAHTRAPASLSTAGCEFSTALEQPGTATWAAPLARTTRPRITRSATTNGAPIERQTKPHPSSLDSKIRDALSIQSACTQPPISVHSLSKIRALAA